MKRIIVILLSLLSLTCARSQTLSVSANLADCLNLGTMNIGASYGFAMHWSVQTVLKYNPFEWNVPGAAEDVMQAKQRMGGAGVRYWPWHIYSGWWLENRIQWQEFSTSAYSPSYAEEGNRVGDAISAGYTYMLSRHFNLELGFGVWMGYGTVTRYACPRCGRVLSSNADYFVRPSEAVLSVSYVF